MGGVQTVQPSHPAANGHPTNHNQATPDAAAAATGPADDQVANGKEQPVKRRGGRAGKQAAAAVAIKRPAKITVKGGRRFLASDVAFIVHFALFSVYLYVFIWHFSPAAAGLPGATGYGWFFRYLTFYSFTLQMAQLFFCCLSDIAQGKRKAGERPGVAVVADDLSCALFGLANVVTVMYYVLELTTRDMVEGGNVQRPWWLGLSVHVFNSFTAWTDLLVAHPRSFSPKAQRLSLMFIGFYTLWILNCRHHNGVFPYPFLNKLPYPQGFLGVFAGALTLFYCLFKLGKALSDPILQWKIKVKYN